MHTQLPLMTRKLYGTKYFRSCSYLAIAIAKIFDVATTSDITKSRKSGTFSLLTTCKSFCRHVYSNLED